MAKEENFEFKGKHQKPPVKDKGITKFDKSKPTNREELERNATITEGGRKEILQGVVKTVDDGAKELINDDKISKDQRISLKQFLAEINEIPKEKGLSEVGKLAKAKKALEALGKWVEKQVSHAKEAVKKAFQGFGETVTKAAESVSEGLKKAIGLDVGSKLAKARKNQKREEGIELTEIPREATFSRRRSSSTGMGRG